MAGSKFMAVNTGTVCRVRPLAYTKNGKAVLNFTVVTNRTKPDPNGGEPVKEAMYIEYTAWEGLAEMLAKSLSSGDKEAGVSASVVWISSDWMQAEISKDKEGKIWLDAEGNARTVLKANIKEITFITGGLYGKGSVSQDEEGPRGSKENAEDIPF